MMARVAIVTGAAQSIGRAIALRLAEDGLDVAVNDLPARQPELASLVAEIEAKGRRSCALIADVSDQRQVEEMVAGAVKELGKLDVMVANAGVIGHGSVLDVTIEGYERILSVNVRGVLLCYKHAARQMVAQGHGGRILGASSVGGLLARPALIAYSASKFAVRGLTQSAAGELAKHGITVNAYAPGQIDTPMIRAFQPDESKLLPHIPLGRLGQPEDIAHLVSFLASEKSGFITGAHRPFLPR
ncbi:hypothetical protein OF83DRAFT_930305 [Amylostereum chailletii]|nr:hypothetical protein OF83DRAFT_930305 [Amylostereum chailletii]